MGSFEFFLGQCGNFLIHDYSFFNFTVFHLSGLTLLLPRLSVPKGQKSGRHCVREVPSSLPTTQKDTYI